VRNYCRRSKNSNDGPQLDDLKLKLNDLMGLPLTTVLDLDPVSVRVSGNLPARGMRYDATASHPEILEARVPKWRKRKLQSVGQDRYLGPAIGGIRGNSYQNNVPFLARNFGTFGIPCRV